MSYKSTPYIPLSDSDLDIHEGFPSKPALQSRWRLLTFVFFGLSLGLNVVFACFWLSDHRRDIHSSKSLYSPAQDVIDYHVVKFDSGFGHDIPIYDRSPSEEVDAAWESLYEFAYNKIPREQAQLLPNKTYPVLDQDGQYMIALDVFHQLHCLNQMRKAMYPEYYEATPEGIHTPHMAHCISSLRQSLMCSADVTPIVWQWSPRSKKVFERSDVVHTCRNFDKIRGWARDHFLDHQQDMTVYIEDNLEIESF
ncbi:hypothetical protein K435DRAFT_227317 [Dendrothele bispora CBS 962.96]|uniref:Tat pathway signal sequence n=1 Tax=Dendrothele bispora (strain CBS 962.96) TaxID=1314807 RepID=A0A4S8LQC6_DENBC|nr:hypothetical protein K435DRAFT_227317 [Dendrothele bispora CBS 962.96]